MPMRDRLFTAMLALLAIPGLALGGDELPKPPTLLPVSEPASQAASSPSPVSTQSGLRTSGVLDNKPEPDFGEPCSKLDWTCGPPSCFWLRGEYLLWWMKD